MAIEAEALRDAALFDAQSINDSDRVISVFAAPEWDELSIDGKEWVRAIIAETLSRHRSALPEDTARAAEGWETIQNCPSDGRLILVFGGPWYLSPAPKEADGDWWRTSTARGLGAAPTHWCPLPAPPALPLDKEAADANR